jgi:hypothetical protein
MNARRKVSALETKPALALTHVCALHEQQRTPVWKLIKKSKNTN